MRMSAKEAPKVEDEMILTSPHLAQPARVRARVDAMLLKIGKEPFGLLGTDDQETAQRTRNGPLQGRQDRRWRRCVVREGGCHADNAEGEGGE